MLGIEERAKLERKILGAFLELPQLGKVECVKLKSNYFTSETRQNIFNFILSESKKGKVVTLNEINETELDIQEITECVLASNLPNLKPNIRELITETFYDDLWRLGQSIQDMVVNDATLETIIQEISKVTSQLDPDFENEYDMTMDQALGKIETGQLRYKEYPIGWKAIDEHMPFSSQSITIVGGNEGTFKTKLMIYCVRLLLMKYPNISVLWYSMEDPADKLIRGFVAQETLLDDATLKRGRWQDIIPDDVKKYDIEFVTKSSTIKEVGQKYAEFRSKRDGKFNLLIIDNIMKIIPINKGREMDVDLEIIREIESWNIKTSPKENAVILLHHFTKATLEESNLKNAYEPEMIHLRGAGRYKDFCTNAMLINSMYYHSSIKKLFKRNVDFIEKYYIVKIDKNRNGKKKIIRMLAYPEFNHFYQIGK